VAELYRPGPLAAALDLAEELRYQGDDRHDGRGDPEKA